MLRPPAVALLAIALCGCARGAAIEAPASPDEANLPPRGYTVSCDADSCPSAVGLFVGPGDSEAEPMHCTAALVDRSTVVTAGHCVGLDTRACDGAWIGFPEENSRRGSSLEWVGCKRVQYVQVPEAYTHLAANDDAGYLEPDYAIIELERAVARTPIEVSDTQASAGDVVRMYSVKSDRYYSELHQIASRRCRVADDAQLGVLPKEVRMLSACPIRKGDSGAPLLSEDGELLGIVHAGTPPYFAMGVMTALRNKLDCPKPKPKLRAKCTGSISHF